MAEAQGHVPINGCTCTHTRKGILLYTYQEEVAEFVSTGGDEPSKSHLRSPKGSDNIPHHIKMLKLRT